MGNEPISRPSSLVEPTSDLSLTFLTSQAGKTFISLVPLLVGYVFDLRKIHRTLQARWACAPHRRARILFGDVVLFV